MREGLSKRRDVWEGLAGTVVREGLSKRRDVCKSIFWREKGTGTIRVRTNFFWLFGLDKQ